MSLLYHRYVTIFTPANCVNLTPINYEAASENYPLFFAQSILFFPKNFRLIRKKKRQMWDLNLSQMSWSDFLNHWNILAVFSTHEKSDYFWGNPLPVDSIVLECSQGKGLSIKLTVAVNIDTSALKNKNRA